MNARSPLLPDLPGLVPGVSEGSFTATLAIGEYHAISEYISHSGMKELLRSPAHYLEGRRSKSEDDGKVNFGSAVHSAILEPADFQDRYVVFDGTRRGKAYDEFKALHGGKIILNADEFERIDGIAKAISNFSDFPIADALRMGESEKSIFWINHETGAPCRIRTDSINPFAIFDLKTIDDCRPDKIAAQIMRMDYDLQAFMYKDGTAAFTGDHRPFNFIFVEDKKPHGVWLYTAGATLLESGREKFLRGAKAFLELGQANLLQCYPNAFSVIEAPAWRRRELGNLAARAEASGDESDVASEPI